MKVLTILQARMTSSRLPGKVLMDIEGMPMIGHQIERIQKSKLVTDIVVATSVDQSDDELVRYIESLGVNVQRGPLEDVLQRFINVLDVFNYENIVRLTADCPLVDSDVLDATIEHYFGSTFDYVSNCLVRTFPTGLDVEVFKAEALRQIAETDRSPLSREHVTYGIYSRPEVYSTSNYFQNPSFAHLRWTVDTQQDLEFVRNAYKHLFHINRNFLQSDILNWLEEYPEYSHFESSGKL